MWPEPARINLITSLPTIPLMQMVQMEKPKTDGRFFIISILAAAVLGASVVIAAGKAYTGSGMRFMGAMGAVGAVILARLLWPH